MENQWLLDSTISGSGANVTPEDPLLRKRGAASTGSHLMTSVQNAMRCPMMRTERWDCQKALIGATNDPRILAVLNWEKT